MKPVVILYVFAASVLVFAGCRGIPAPGEKQARHDLGAVTGKYRPGNHPAAMPELTPDSSLSNFLAYALLNSPAVEATYYDWSASVESITVTRSLPDPQLTFQSDIANVVETIMPGFLQEFPGPGKLKARARVAGAESRAKYFAFESAVLQSAFNLKNSYYKLGLLTEQLRLQRATLSLLENQESVIRAQNVAGASSLPELLRVQSEQDRVRNEIANLEDSHRPLLENFKAALGLPPEQSAPPVPARFETGGDNPDADELLRSAFARNPQLKAMEADVRAAEAGIAVAYKSRVPDFSLGLMADVKAYPTVFRPLAGVTLPIWRDKIAAETAQARANEMAAKSRLKAAQIDLAVSFAEKSFAYRETSRNLTLFDDELIPKASQTLETVRAGYRADLMDFSSLTDAERMLLELELNAAEVRTARDIALADLSLMVAGVPPANAPLLSNNSQP
jgi:cobalt-zinc-cadmium efflux system outer membrane protein